MKRYDGIKKSYGDKVFDAVYNSKILVVGAGGIGCELLKNLVMTGFRDIHVIDLDTIDVSNLNRQFLFRPEHVGKPKAIIAAEAAMNFNPDAKIKAYHGNIKDSSFGINFISTFNLVLNALDNLDARRHVNRLCIATDIPLIESGTTGYLGQVMPIRKNQTACYECQPKPTQKVYPICTIRSTPDKPVHCIVWAKECHKLLFGNTAESMLYEDPNNSEKSTYMSYVSFCPEEGRWSSDQVAVNGKALITALFNTEVHKRISMEVYKTSRSPPVPLDFDVINNGCNLMIDILQSKRARPSEAGEGWDHSIWSDVESVAEFILCLYDISLLQRTALADGSPGVIGSLTFDKDDNIAMKFVAAATNLRSRIFSIDLLSFHDAKGVAGNIIPAIATTNAIIAGLQVIEAFRILSSPNGNVGELCKQTYCLRNATRKGLFLQPSTPDLPSPDCYVCNVVRQSVLIDTTRVTLGQFLARVVKDHFRFAAPSLQLEGGSIIYEEGDDADESLLSNLTLTLCQCPAGGVKDGSEVSVEDFTQSLEIVLVIRHIDESLLDPEKFPTGNVIGTIEEVNAILQNLLDPPPPAAAATENYLASLEAADDDLVVVADADAASAAAAVSVATSGAATASAAATTSATAGSGAAAATATAASAAAASAATTSAAAAASATAAATAATVSATSAATAAVAAMEFRLPESHTSQSSPQDTTTTTTSPLRKRKRSEEDIEGIKKGKE